jgi:hypothetical protein
MLASCLLLAFTLAGAAEAPAVAPRIHSVSDISHEFSFYMDGRFFTQYTAPTGGADGRNWGTLHKCDLSNVNLLVLASGATPCPYLPQDIAAIERFLQDGGGVVLLGDYGLFREEEQYRTNELAMALGAFFSETPAREPLEPAPALGAAEVKFYGGKALQLQRPYEWEVLIRDADRRVLLARRKVGKGTLLVGARGLAGQRPDASDPINAAWWTPLLQQAAAGKPVDASRDPEGQGFDNTESREGLQLSYSDYMAPEADAIMAVYAKVRPAQERIMGVPPAPGMLTNLLLLPTGGGGFSSGVAIGLGVWWGDFPAKQYGMVELLGHEATHSWVLPFPEPMWNEGIATYVGVLLGRELGLADDAEATLKGWIDGARKVDPDMTKCDLATGKDVPHVVGMAKPMWIFEQLRAEQPDIVARYFQAKRRLIDPATRDRYTADDSVAVLSNAAGRDLFGWFQSLGISVDRERTTVPMP